MTVAPEEAPVADRGREAPLERILAAGGAPLARIAPGEGGPVVGVALHDGHAVRPSLLPLLALGDEARTREEDPHTSAMLPEWLPRIEVLRSRFEVDLNRPRFRAVYQGPRDAWGLSVWNGELPDAEDRTSRSVYDAFYAAAFEELARTAETHPRFVVLDIHSYNHRRDGAHEPPADPGSNPEVNLGTGRIVDRDRWQPVIGAFVRSFSESGFDVRENVKFQGGHFAHWVSDTFPDQGCALAIEFKKTYMDEWTGIVDETAVHRARQALERAARAVAQALDAVR